MNPLYDVRRIALGASLLAATSMAACTNSKQTAEALAKVGDTEITKESFQSSLETLPPQWKARAKTPSGRKQILEHQVRSQLIELEAKDRGIDSRPQVKYQIDQAVQRILLQELMKEWQKEFEIPEDQLRAYYDKNEKKYSEPEKFRAQHVLIKVAENAPKSEADKARTRALDAKKRIQGGEPFEKVAKAISEGPSASKGGDLGYVERGRFHKNFEEVALNAKPGDLSDPVRTPFGWHIIKLIDIKPASDKPFEEVKEDIKKQVMPRKRQEAFEAFMSSLKSKYEVSIDEEKLAKAAAQAAEAPSK